jgi:predicted nucleotidyltransferase
VRRVREQLGDELVGVILAGSYATGEALDVSDVDVAVVCEHPLDLDRKQSLVSVLRHDALPSPARKLELVVYRRAVVEQPGHAVPFELNLNTGRYEEHVAYDAAEESPHWFVLDLAIARGQGSSLYGPAPAELIGEVDPDAVRAALLEALDWWQHELPDSPNTLLSACRAWRWAEHGDWLSKRAAGEWAMTRSAHPEAIAAAIERRPLRQPVDPSLVAAVSDEARAALEALGSRS